MAVSVRQRTLPSGTSYWQADIRVRLPDGSVHRERRKAPGRTRRQALRWAEEREIHIIRHGPPARRGAAPAARPSMTFAEFVPVFLRDHVEANRLAPTTRLHYDVVLRNHLVPVLGERRLGEIGARDVQALKRRGLKASTTNGLIKKLRAILRQAEEWGYIASVPRFTQLREEQRAPAFYDFDEYERLVEAAAGRGPSTHAIVLLGGDAGLRRGEIRGLRWTNVHLSRNRINVCEQLSSTGERRLPKGGKTREVPITKPLRACLEHGLRERRGAHVVCRRADGEPLSGWTLACNLATAQRHAGLPARGPHVLRHTFCSHLAMRGAPQRTIQQLAGHAKSSTTEVYMHLAEWALDDAISRLR